MRRLKQIFLFFIILRTLKFSLLLAQSPLEVAKKVADKVMRESSFEFELVPQATVLGMQVMDFQQQFGEGVIGIGYALSFILSEKDSSVLFGFSCGNPVKIWLNEQLIFSQRKRPLVVPREIAYNRFIFQDTLQFKLKKGANKILIKTVRKSKPWIFFLRAIQFNGDENTAVKFSLDPIAPKMDRSNWLCLGILPGDDLDNPLPPESEFKNYYWHEGQLFCWSLPRANTLLELKINPTNTFKRESYLDWHYANGAMMLGLLALGDATGEKKYLDFVQKYVDFILAHQDYFRWQYEHYHAYRGSYHRLFRRSMLDDAGAPALPFLELFDRTRNPDYWRVIEPLANYVLNEQVRLTNGTFCRSEPVALTVWADDLFMSVPFLLRMGKITGQRAYFDDAARQIVNFSKLLFDEQKQLFYHGWFSETKRNSIACWGRANGWAIWATSEALLFLPKDHPHYRKILDIYRRHIKGLAKVQDKSGMWHQVLDHPESYEESSCTAMFVLGIARGIHQGWLDKKYQAAALKGWQALCQKIAADGTVHGICRGTEIGNDLAFYFNRATFDHDPRGLGAVIVAAVEMARMMQLK
ncbi:MAG: glycoside hydrolase family 88 protein [candidate division KSB1 bacterium]|nr:glycoside hydrolase family 88 protein [candidate division KSB1 bacterium]